MPPLHRRVTQLRDAFGQGGLRSRITRRLSGSSLPSAATAAPVPPAGVGRSPTSSGESAAESGEDENTGPGRPEIKLDESTERGLVRLLVEMPKTPIEQLAKALKKSGGPGRLWLRNFYQWVTGAGKGSDIKLKEIRLKHGDALRDEDEVDYDDADQAEDESDDSAVRQASVIPVVDPGPSLPYYDSVTSSVISQSDAPAETSGPLRKMPQRKRNLPLPPAGDRDLVESIPPSTYEVSSEQDVIDMSLMASAPIGRSLDHVATLNPSGELQPPGIGWDRSIPMSGHGTQSQPSADTQDATYQSPQNKKPEAKRNDKPKKNSRKRKLVKSLTLTNVAKWLDGDKKGAHYRVAKGRTVSFNHTPTFSSRRRGTGGSEFSLYYHRPGATTFNPAASGVFPTPASVLSVREPRNVRVEAVAANYLVESWRQRREDDQVRQGLEAMLPQRADEQTAFVNADDELGTTPLHLAVAYGWPHTCSFLVNHHADITATTNKGTDIYAFAEPAARLAGEDLRLYFRILHCRTFVREGQCPPAPKRPAYPESNKNKRNKKNPKKRQPKAPASRQPGQAPFKSESEREMPQTTTSTAFTNTSSVPSTEIPSHWTEWPYTESPRSSGFYRNNSLPDQENALSNWIKARRATAAPPSPDPSFRRDPSLAFPPTTTSAFETPNTAPGNAGYPAPGPQYGTMMPPYNPYRPPPPPPPPHPIQRQAPQPMPPRSLYSAPGGFQWNPMPPQQRPANFSRSNSSGSAVRSSPQPTATMTTAATDFAPRTSPANQQFLIGLPFGTPQGMFTRVPVGNANVPPQNYDPYRQNYWSQPTQQPFNNHQYNYPSPMVPQTTAQQIIPAAARCTDQSALYLDPFTPTPAAEEAPWICLFSDPQCQSEETCCARCRREYGVE